jgi:hypothetical protein
MFGDSRAAAMNIIRSFADITKDPPTESGRKLLPEEVQILQGEIREFAKALERDHQNISVFTVMPKGIYDTRALIERPEDIFPNDLHSILGAQMLADLRQGDVWLLRFRPRVLFMCAGEPKL